MQTKLTLRLEKSLIEQAKQHSKRSGKSLSQLVADYFLLLQKKSTSSVKIKTAPVTQSLRGVLQGQKIDETDYRQHLEDKYL